MAEQHPDGGKGDTTDYSASKAPETKVEGEETSKVDPRMLPGGGGSPAVAIGMSAIEPEEVPTRGEKPEQLNAQDSPKGVE